MEFREPKWHLRTACPFCQQGASLLLVACPDCRYIAVKCEEEGAIFDRYTLPLAAAEVDPDATLCPKCRQRYVRDFVIASAEVIVAAGISPAEYF